MLTIVILAQLATVGFFVIFLAYAAMHADPRPAFEITTRDPVGRTLIRSVQVAFVIGYGIFFLGTAVRAAGLV